VGGAGQELTVGIDIGTTSVKAVAVDADGKVVARARAVHPIDIPAPDRFQHDAALAWRANVVAALDDIRAQLGVDDEVVGVNVASMVPSLAAVDADGVPVSAGLLYGDGRGRVGDVSDPHVHGEARQFLAWLLGEHPDAAGYWPAVAVANRALGGDGRVGRGGVAALFPLFDFMAGGWNQAVLDAVGVGLDRLPALVDPGEPAGTVDGLPGAVLGPGAVDAMAEQIVAGIADDGDVLVICGTTLIIWGVIAEMKPAPGVWTMPHTTPGKFLVGGPSNAGGLFLNWAQAALASDGPAASDEPEDPQRVPVWMPYVRGERTPLHDPDRRAALHGLDLSHGAPALRRAAFEAAGFVTRHHLDLGAAAGLTPRRIVATGGGVRVAPWVQALADCTGLPVDVVAVPEGGALGSAWLARMAAGLETSEADAARWARTDHRVEPRPAWVEAADARYRVFRDHAGGP
jgi:xylulokinase